MNPTPLEVAAALRSAAEFCRDPDSPKARHIWARTADGANAYATDPKATSWCALGYVCLQLGLRDPHSLPMIHMSRISVAFDCAFTHGNFEFAALACEQVAAAIEDSLPLAAERVTRDEVKV